MHDVIQVDEEEGSKSDKTKSYVEEEMKRKDMSNTLDAEISRIVY